MRVLLFAALRAAARDRELRDDRRPDWSFLESPAVGPGFRRREDEGWPQSAVPNGVSDSLLEEENQPLPMQHPARPPRTAVDDRQESWSYLESKHRLERAKIGSESTPKAAPKFSGTGVNERAHGAPQDGWHNCATLHGNCQCSHGHVRFGRRGKKVDVWTQPIPMGVKTETKCELLSLMDVRLHVEDKPGPVPTRQCQCMERRMRISKAFGPAAKKSPSPSLAEEGKGIDDDLDAELYGEDPADLPPDGDYCLAIVKPESSLMQTSEKRGIEGLDELNELVQYELSTEVVFEKCEPETGIGTKHEWVFQQASGQLRHSKSGKCLGVYWKDGKPHITGNDCTFVESQVALQRWRLPFYTDGGPDEASGEIRVGYGGTTANALCIHADSHKTEGLSVGPCGKSTSEWDTKRITAHEWKVCAQENAKCDGDQTSNCVGEIRFGDGENDNWAFPIAVPTTEGSVAAIACSPVVLKEISVVDPVMVPDMDDPDFRECQCKGGGGGALGGGSGAIIAGCVVGALVVAGGVGFFVMKGKKKKGEDGEWEEEEEWEEEGGEWAEEGEWQEGQ